MLIMFSFDHVENFDHVVVSVSIDFPISSKEDALFHYIACGYHRADWDCLCDHLRDVPWDDIFKLSATTAAHEFRKWFKLELMYISLIVSIRSNLMHRHVGFSCLCCCHSS